MPERLRIGDWVNVHVDTNVLSGRPMKVRQAIARYEAENHVVLRRLRTRRNVTQFGDVLCATAECEVVRLAG